MICPLCGASFDPALHRFTWLRPMVGRRAGYAWFHRSPQGRGCTYADGGPVEGYTRPVACGKVDVTNNAPDEALAPTG